ncbi:MAG: hypothetical protein WDA06_09530 [Phenylobacterium sp.]
MLKLLVGPWMAEWVCTCGKRFRASHQNKFLDIGRHHLCPQCGQDIGLDGIYIYLEVVRYVKCQGRKIREITRRYKEAYDSLWDRGSLMLVERFDSFDFSRYTKDSIEELKIKRM